MPTFTYITRNAAGKESKGTLSAPNEKDAVNTLRRQNLIILSIKPKKEGFKINLFAPSKPKAHVSSEDIAIFTRQLATLISSGVPLLESLIILSDQAKDKGFRITLQEISEKIRGGKDFSTALSDYPKLFSGIYINMVKAGEASGQLDQVLVRLAEYSESSEALRREIKSAMTYPVISLAMIILIVTGLLVFIVPKFEEMFRSLHIDLPLPTRILLATSHFLSSQWYIPLGIVVLAVIGLKFVKKTEWGRYALDASVFHLPVFGTLFKKVSIARFAGTFATLLQSGVPILQTLEIVAATSGNKVLEKAILLARDEVKKGELLSLPLEKTGVFPIMVTRMIGIGEKTGALETLLNKIAEFYDQQVKTTVKALTSLIEPLLILVMGFLVGGIVLAIFLPILKIQESLRHH